MSCCTIFVIVCTIYLHTCRYFLRLVISSRAKFGIADFAFCQFNVVMNMWCSKGKIHWHPMLLLAFFLRSHWPPDYCQPTMVRLIDATACAGKADLKPEDVLKPENLAKAASEMKSLSAKDIYHQCSRDLRERYPELSKQISLWPMPLSQCLKASLQL